MLVQTKFEVCLGVRSGPNGTVIDLSIFGLESLSKQNLGFAIRYILSRRALSLIVRSVVAGLPAPLEICSSVRRFGGPNACPNKI